MSPRSPTGLVCGGCFEGVVGQRRWGRRKEEGRRAKSLDVGASWYHRGGIPHVVPTLVVRILSRPTDAEAVDPFRGPLQWRKSNGSKKAHRRHCMVVCVEFVRICGSSAALRSDIWGVHAIAPSYPNICPLDTLITEFFPRIPPYIRTFAAAPLISECVFSVPPYIRPSPPKKGGPVCSKFDRPPSTRLPPLLDVRHEQTTAAPRLRGRFVTAARRRFEGRSA